MTETIARDIASTLRACGLEHFFMLTGGDQPLWIALRDAGIRMVVARSEASAVYMADGFARASGKPAIAYGQAGPGAANVAAALADPFWAQSPVIALTGANATNAMHVVEYQSLDQSSMFDAVTKWNGAVADPVQAAALTRKAVQLALSGTPGPTHLDVPKNFFGLPSAKPGARLLRPLPPRAVAPFDAEALAPVVDALQAAQRPAILVGEGVRFACAWDALARLSSTAGLPIFTTMGGKPAVLSSHPNLVGVVGRYSSVAANRLLAESDCVLTLGTRLGGLATNGYRVPSPDAILLQVDTDPHAFANPYFPEICVQADLHRALPALAHALHEPLVAPKGWLQRCRTEAREWHERLLAATAESLHRPLLSPLAVIDALRAYASEVTLVADTGYMAAWTGVLYPVERPDTFYRATGSLGWALPAALGVQLARREKVVCVTGDGGAGYHLADIETAVRHRLPVVVLVLNNDCLAFEYHEQKYRWNGNVVAEANDFAPVDYARAAEGLGAIGRRVETPGELHDALALAMRADRPCVLDIAVDREAFPPVTNFDAHLQRAL
jgi:acetolactate synthase-1/2/3 large subunit